MACAATVQAVSRNGRDVPRFTVSVTFTSQAGTPLANAVVALKALEIEAPTNEAAELYGSLIVVALERAA
jgi:hypothetical protein